MLSRFIFLLIRLSSTGVVVTLSVNSIRSSSTVHCTSPLSNNQDFNSSFPIPSMQHFATNTSMMACDQPLFVMLRHQQSSIKLFAVKVTYRLAKVEAICEECEKMKSGDSGCPHEHSGQEVQRQLFWLPELTVEIISTDKVSFV